MPTFFSASYGQRMEYHIAIYIIVLFVHFFQDNVFNLKGLGFRSNTILIVNADLTYDIHIDMVVLTESLKHVKHVLIVTAQHECN